LNLVASRCFDRYRIVYSQGAPQKPFVDTRTFFPSIIRSPIPPTPLLASERVFPAEPLSAGRFAFP
jgi:hypothetical protein